VHNRLCWWISGGPVPALSGADAGGGGDGKGFFREVEGDKGECGPEPHVVCETQGDGAPCFLLYKAGVEVKRLTGEQITKECLKKPLRS